MPALLAYVLGDAGEGVLSVDVSELRVVVLLEGEAELEGVRSLDERDVVVEGGNFLLVLVANAGGTTEVVRRRSYRRRRC